MKKKKAPLKVYLCIEHGEEFIIEARSMDQAIADAAVWGASVIREVINPKKVQLSKDVYAYDVA